MSHGGKRQGSGNKAGRVRPKITDYWSQEDIQSYFDYLKDNYKGNAVLTKFVGEQLMGKAPQPQEHSGEVNLTGVEVRVMK